MNERIRELVEQAGMTLKPRRLYNDNEPDGYLESDLDYLNNNLEATRVFFEGGLEKFAELIVGECIDTISDCSVEYCTRPQIVNEIKEHFFGEDE